MIVHDKSICTDCSTCLKVCPNLCFEMSPESGITFERPSQCAYCDHCVAICPVGALSNSDIPMEEFTPRSPSRTTPDDMESLIRGRRSIRAYKEKQVTDEQIEKLLSAAFNAGTASNGQSEGFIVLQDRSTMNRLDRLVISTLWNAGLKYMGSKFMLKLMSLLYAPEMLRQYMHYYKLFGYRTKTGKEDGTVFRNAPTAIIVHGLKTNKLAQANAAVAIRNMELMGETMGLGSCWVGFLPSAAAMNKEIDTILGIPKDRTVVGSLLIGHPVYEYSKTIPRSQRETRWIR